MVQKPLVTDVVSAVEEFSRMLFVGTSITEIYLFGELFEQRFGVPDEQIFTEKWWNQQREVVLVCLAKEGEQVLSSSRSTKLPVWKSFGIAQRETWQEVIKSDFDWSDAISGMESVLGDIKVSLVVIPASCQFAFWSNYVQGEECKFDFNAKRYVCARYVTLTFGEKWSGFKYPFIDRDPWRDAYFTVEKQGKSLELAQLLLTLSEVEEVFLFGSLARGTSVAEDIDIGILVSDRCCWPEIVLDEAMVSGRWLYEKETDKQGKRAWDSILRSVGVPDKFIYKVKQILGKVKMDLVIMYADPSDQYLLDFLEYGSRPDFLPRVAEDFRLYKAGPLDAPARFEEAVAPWQSFVNMYL